MNRAKSLSLLLVLSTFSLLHNARAHLEGEGIVGGENAELGNYTYQVSLNRNSHSFCGGAIIDKWHIITAAHCVTDKFGDLLDMPIKVIAGVIDLNGDDDEGTRVDHDVEVVYIPKEYNPQTENRIIGDIAVLKLLLPLDLDYNQNLKFLHLADASETYAGKTALISGFGWNVVYLYLDEKTRTVQEIGKSYDKMRYAETNVLSNEQCIKLISSLKPVGNGHICAQVVQRDTELEGICSGDSGGPLVYNGNTLIGVVSTSPMGCMEKMAPAVYTRVSEYLDFIQKATDGVDDPKIRYTYLKIEGVNAL